MPCPEDTAESRRRQGGAFGLALSTGLIGLVWLVALPTLANRPAMQAHLQWLDEHRIDPSAMYYTELESAEPILKRLERTRRQAELASPIDRQCAPSKVERKNK